MTYQVRFDYAGPYKSYDRAMNSLEDCYATGEVCEAEQPHIEGRKVRHNGSSVTQWFITLPM